MDLPERRKEAIRMKKGHIAKIRETDTEKELYVIGLCVLVIGAVIYVAASLSSVSLSSILEKNMGICPFYRLTGWLCPGCGGTRSFRYFLHGQFVKSIRFNAFVFYMMACYVVFMISQTARFVSKDRYKGMKFHMRYIYIGIAIAILQFIIKNGQLHSWF